MDNSWVYKQREIKVLQYGSALIWYCFELADGWTANLK